MQHDGAARLDRIAALLDAQRGAIRRGDIASLGQVGEQLEALLHRLGPSLTRDDAPRLDRLKREARETQRLLGAALRGVQAARSRVTAIRDAGARLNTYDSRGRAQSVSFGDATVERRA